LEKYEAALKDFEAALAIASGSDVAIKGATRIRAALRKQAKEKS